MLPKVIIIRSPTSHYKPCIIGLFCSELRWQSAHPKSVTLASLIILIWKPYPSRTLCVENPHHAGHPNADIHMQPFLDSMDGYGVMHIICFKITQSVVSDERNLHLLKHFRVMLLFVNKIIPYWLYTGT